MGIDTQLWLHSQYPPRISSCTYTEAAKWKNEKKKEKSTVPDQVNPLERNHGNTSGIRNEQDGQRLDGREELSSGASEQWAG